MRKLAFLFIVFSALAFSGCGYTTRSGLATGESSVYVENFTNKIDVTSEVSYENPYYAYIPGMESDITREIIDRFIFDGNYKIRDSENASLLLKGKLVDFKRDSLRYDADENVIEYRLRAAVDMELYDNREGKLLWQERGFAGEATYRTTGQFASSENAAVEEALKDLARRVVERTVENW